MDEKINEEEVKEVIPEYILSCAGTFTEKESNDLAKYLAGKTKVKYLVIMILGAVCAGLFIALGEYLWFGIALAEVAFCIFGLNLNLRRINTLCENMMDIFKEPVNIEFYSDRIRAELAGESISYTYPELHKVVVLKSMWGLYLGSTTSMVILPASRDGFGSDEKCMEFEKLLGEKIKPGKIKAVKK